MSLMPAPSPILTPAQATAIFGAIGSLTQVNALLHVNLPAGRTTDEPSVWVTQLTDATILVHDEDGATERHEGLEAFAQAYGI